MSILASKKGSRDYDRKFSKELFSAVADNLTVFSDDEWESINSDETAVKEHKKVLIAVYIRTDKDNLVLTLDKGKFAQVSNVPPAVAHGGLYPSILVDSGLICAKSLLDQAFTVSSEEALKRLVFNSTCYPVGAVETSKKFVLVFNVVLSVDLLRDPEISLNSGFHFHPIETLSLTDSLQSEISESLILVKK